ncbi:MAG: hypothetical protein ACAI35_13855 [Candidatus Methylacidiphilales bacterium]|nr:hypothetical protein [Candidatus Methylacidiphilales bacterium]
MFRSLLSWLKRYRVLCAGIVLALLGGLIFYLGSKAIICKERVAGLAWSQDGLRVAYISKSDYIGTGVISESILSEGSSGIWSLHTVRPLDSSIWGRIKLSLRTSPTIPYWMEWSPDGKALLLEDYDRLILFSVGKGSPYFGERRDRVPGLCNIWTPDNRLLSLSADESCAKVAVRLIPPDPTRSPGPTSETVLDLPPERAHAYYNFESKYESDTHEDEKLFAPRLVRWSPTAGRLLFISDCEQEGKGSLWCYDCAEQRDMGTLLQYDYRSPNRPRDYVWSPNGKSVALLFLPAPPTTADARIELWDVEKRVLFQTLTLPNSGQHWAAELVPILARPDPNSNMTVEFHIYLDSAHQIAWSRDGKRLAAAFMLEPKSNPRDASIKFAAPKSSECDLYSWNVADARVLTHRRVTSSGVIDVMRIAPDLEKVAISSYTQIPFFGGCSIIRAVRMSP